MDHPLLRVITSPDPRVRDQSLDAFCSQADTRALLDACAALDAFRREAPNLYERVRALFFLYAIYRFHLPPRLEAQPALKGDGEGLIPFHGHEQLLQRRFAEAIDTFLAAAGPVPSDALASALAAAYHRLAFQTLANQVRRSVRSVRGNQWMFRVGNSLDQPLRLRRELLVRNAAGAFPVLHEQTPVRMDLTHCGWSDIFFLAMDHPEGAKVLNVSVDLGVYGRDSVPRPPVNAYLRVLDEPVLRLTSVDLGCSDDLKSLAEVFDFGKDYLGLLKAAVIASGIVPPGIEGSGQQLADLLSRVVGPGLGLELVSSVNDIPKGSRLAVSTNLLACLISVCMRATSQAKSLTGALAETERRIVLARALLGEWLSGSGGGWQDSGGLWPGIKLISGCPASTEDPESGISRGRLMPNHHVLDRDEIPDSARRALLDSLVLVHGGMAQNVGPILEMVTEKYLLRSGPEWVARQSTHAILREILGALQGADMRSLGACTTRNFVQPIQSIIPWASNHFTESLIARMSADFGDDFWGFCMLGGMSGGGMGFLFAPARVSAAKERLLATMRELKRDLQQALPFAMEPAVFDYTINERGTWCDLLDSDAAVLPPGYYALIVPRLLRRDLRQLPRAQRADLDRFAAACRTRPELSGAIPTLFDALLPRAKAESPELSSLPRLLERHGFDQAQHEQIRSELRDGRIGLAQNRLRPDTTIEDVAAEDVTDACAWVGEPAGDALAASDGCDGQPPSAASSSLRDEGLAALRRGELAVVTLAAGAGSRWTQGAGTCKAIHPFARLGERHRTFLEVHLAKSRRRSQGLPQPLAHVITTSHLTHEAIAACLERAKGYGYPGPIHLSPGRAVGLRLVPMERDLRFQWEETPQQVLDEQQEKMRQSVRSALLQWARSAGEGTDYIDNAPLQCLHPVGHFFEIPNLLRNGVLAALLRAQPNLRHLLLHNIDTLGADVDPALFGQHLRSGACLSFEVIRRRLEDRGGGLARVDGRPRLVEGLALPRDEDEFRLRYYNTMTTWIHLDRFLGVLGLTRADILDADKPGDGAARTRVTAAIRHLAARLPTYITLKDVKKRWGHGQEDIFPVAQFEKLWSDLTALPEMDVRFIVVPRWRGQQLKDQAQLDGWLRDGTADRIARLCAWH